MYLEDALLLVLVAKTWVYVVAFLDPVLDTFFRQIKSFLRFRLAFVFGLQTYYLIDFSKIYRLKGLEPKNKG